MKILHTSDWHLGKQLEGNSRIDEQIMFLEEFLSIVIEKKPDIIIIAGDIYDTSNPPTKAEELFYEYMEKFTQNDTIPVCIISGNHDNPSRLTASAPVSNSKGILLVGSYNTVIPVGIHKGFSITESGNGYIKLTIKNEKLVLINMPYPSEKRLNQLFTSDLEEKEMQKSYSYKVGNMFLELEKNFDYDSVNIGTGHFYVTGGENTDSERNIQLGGAYAVNSCDLPQKAQYIALGHLHKAQYASNSKKAFYTGSPIQYSKSESGSAKLVALVDISPNTEFEIEKIYLRNYKPIEVWKANSIEHALLLCKENQDKNIWVFLEIKTERVILPSEIKEMRQLKSDILEIRPIMENESIKEIDEYKEISIIDSFINFYNEVRGVNPGDEIISLFEESLLLYDEEETDIGGE